MFILLKSTHSNIFKILWLIMDFFKYFFFYLYLDAQQKLENLIKGFLYNVVFIVVKISEKRWSQLFLSALKVQVFTKYVKIKIICK